MGWRMVVDFGDFMVIYGDLMVIEWWFNGGFMVILWWFMVIYGDWMGDTLW